MISWFEKVFRAIYSRISVRLSSPRSQQSWNRNVSQKHSELGSNCDNVHWAWHTMEQWSRFPRTAKAHPNCPALIRFLSISISSYAIPDFSFVYFFYRHHREDSSASSLRLFFPSSSRNFLSRFYHGQKSWRTTQEKYYLNKFNSEKKCFTPKVLNRAEGFQHWFRDLLSNLRKKFQFWWLRAKAKELSVCCYLLHQTNIFKNVSSLLIPNQC